MLRTGRPSLVQGRCWLDDLHIRQTHCSLACVTTYDGVGSTTEEHGANEPQETNLRRREAPSFYQALDRQRQTQWRRLEGRTTTP